MNACRVPIKLSFRSFVFFILFVPVAPIRHNFFVSYAYWKQVCQTKALKVSASFFKPIHIVITQGALWKFHWSELLFPERSNWMIDYSDNKKCFVVATVDLSAGCVLLKSKLSQPSPCGYSLYIITDKLQIPGKRDLTKNGPWHYDH